MEIPFDQLSSEALTAIIDDFILREGTDYGEQEWSLQQKREDILHQLRKGEVWISFDSDTETCTLSRRD